MSPRGLLCWPALVLTLAAKMVVAPPRPNVAGQEEIEGVFPQVGSGSDDLLDAETAASLRMAMDAADLDMSGGLTFEELKPVFHRIRAKGDPVHLPPSHKNRHCH